MAILGRNLGRGARSALVLTCALALLFALACGGGEEEAATPATSPAAQKAPAQRAEVTQGEVPKSFPDDIPLPADAKPETSIIFPGDAGLMSFRTDATRDEIREHFMKGLAAQGWKVESQEEDARSLVRGAKGNRKATVTITSGEFAVHFENG